MEALALEAVRSGTALAPIISGIIGTVLLIATLGMIDQRQR
jgi:hypothetical protein